MTTLDTQSESGAGTGSNWRGKPLALGLVVLSTLGFLLFSVDTNLAIVRHITFVGFEVYGDRIVFAPDHLQVWRYLTPIFLHFGWLHVVFNCLWTWDLGGKIEEKTSSGALLLLVLLTGTGSNFAQYLVSGPSLFGGMSGVVYALLGFSWVVQYLCPRLGISNPAGVYVLMIGWLLLCMSGLIEVLGFGAIANGAHVGGLVLGVVAGLIYGLWQRVKHRGEAWNSRN